MEGAHWFAVYTKPRWEKKVSETLKEKGVEVYCPLNKVEKQWSDRKKIIHEPLFKGYVFVRITENQKLDVRTVNGIVNFVYWNGKPAVVRDEEIEIIQRFLSEFNDVEVESLSLQVNNQVLIKQGVLVNYQGIVLEVLGNRAKVLVESMGLKLSATIDKKNLQLV